MRERLVAAMPLGRMAEAGDVAAHCLYLLSPACEYVNGECFVVDGGLSLGRNLWSPGERRPSGRVRSTSPERRERSPSKGRPARTAERHGEGRP
jgi:hypothetical protein